MIEINCLICGVCVCILQFKTLLIVRVYVSKMLNTDNGKERIPNGGVKAS